MTKPTYSELEAELLRVRGLLQRAIELLRTVLKASDFYSTTSLKQLIREFVAESADIGKLDSADEKDAPDFPYPDCEAMIRARDGNTTDLAVNILRLWPREQVERFAKHLLGDVAQLGKPLAYCGQDGCRDSITEALLIGRQQGSEQKPAEAHVATEIATEPNEIRVCGKHIVSFAGNEPCGICAGSAETGGEKAAHLPNLSDHCATPGCDHVRAKHGYGAIGYNAASNCQLDDCDCPWWLEPTVPRSSQNQTVSSGVEGAHEGTTADNCTKCGRPRLTALSTVASGMMRDLPQYFCTCVALAESSLSSPPPTCMHGVSLSKPCLECRIWQDSVVANFRQSSLLSESGAESVHSGKQNTADKSELFLPTQLPKEK